MVFSQFTQHGHQGAMEAFMSTMALWMVRGGQHHLDSQPAAQLLKQLTHKFGTLIHEDLFGDARM